MKTIATTLTFALVAMTCLGAFAQVPVSGADGASLSRIVGSDTLVTVILKESGAEDANLKITELTGTYLAAVSEEGKRVVYLFNSIAEVRVQGGIIEKPKLKEIGDQPLSDEEQQVVTRAFARSEEIFTTANNDQGLKIRAATLLALHENEEAKKYLKMLQESNDLKTQLQASQALWLTGEDTPAQLMKDGLRSGNREIRALAARLSGLNNFQDALPTLIRMLQDRVAEISGPASEALAHMGNREVIPTLIEQLKKPNEDKRKSAVFAFSKLGGEDVIEQMKILLKNAEGLLKFNVTLVLYNLGDPLGKEKLVELFRTVPTMEAEAALVLARDGHPEAIQFLRTRLDRREDPTDYNLLFRAENAASLIAGGEPSKKAVFQELLRLENLKVINRVYDLISENGDRSLMTLTKPTIENKNAKIAIGGCETAVSLSSSKYRDRLISVLPRE